MDLNIDNLKYTLRWREPFNGWGDHINIENIDDSQFRVNDTGLCNRILHWELGYYLSSELNSKYKIVIKDIHWPEATLLHLPNTVVDYNKFIDQEHNYNDKLTDLAFKTVFDTSRGKVYSSSEINSDNIDLIMKHPKILNKNNHWYSNFGYRALANYKSIQRKDRPLRKIKLKHPFIESYIKEKTKTLVGIHIRRGNGVYLSSKDLETVPKDIRMQTLNYTTLDNEESSYDFIDDNTYFNAIDQILSINPDQKFYLSYDVPTELIKYFKNKYGNLIVDKFNFYSDIYSYLENIPDIDVDFIEKYGNVLSNLIDLFSLSYTKFKILSMETSTWSRFSSIYTDCNYVYVREFANKTGLDVYKKIRF